MLAAELLIGASGPTWLLRKLLNARGGAMAGRGVSSVAVYGTSCGNSIFLNALIIGLLPGGGCRPRGKVSTLSLGLWTALPAIDVPH